MATPVSAVQSDALHESTDPTTGGAEEPAARPRFRTPNHPAPQSPGGAWSVLPLGLVVVTLLGSVLVPARQTLHILALLRSETEVIAPAQHHEARLEFGLTTATMALQGYARSGDRAFLPAYEQALAGGEQRLHALDSLARRLDPAAVTQVTALSRRVHDWRAANMAVLAPGIDAVRTARALGAQQASYAAALDEATQFAAYLEREAQANEADVRIAEKQGLLVNAALVLVALVTMAAVAVLSRHERFLAGVLRQRILHEQLLRECAEVLGAAFTTDAVRNEVLRMALRLVPGRGASIERPVAPRGAAEVVVVGSVGEASRSAGSPIPLEGSAFEVATGHGALVTIDDGGRVVVPLGNPPSYHAALSIWLAPGTRLGGEESERLRTFSHLATLAFERAGLLEEAQRARERLERVMRSRSRLMRGFSHDVKNPIGAASGHAALLEDAVYGPLNPELRRGVSRIRHALDEALRLIDDLHELTRSETGHLVIVMAPVDAVELLTACVDDFRAAAAAAGLGLEVDLPPGPVIVVTDAVRAGQVVGNMLSNAIKYTATGRIVLRAHLGPTEGDRKGVEPTPAWLDIHVTDSGRGIPVDQLETIFEEFTRFEPHQVRGAGLGLAISRRVARALGGTLTVRSVVGRGSTFTFRVPLVPASTA
jgi:signal transduction histidine kinase